MLTLSKWQNVSSVIKLDVFIFVLQDISTGQFATTEYRVEIHTHITVTSEVSHTALTTVE